MTSASWIGRSSSRGHLDLHSTSSPGAAEPGSAHAGNARSVMRTASPWSEISAAGTTAISVRRSMGSNGRFDVRSIGSYANAGRLRRIGGFAVCDARARQRAITLAGSTEIKNDIAESRPRRSLAHSRCPNRGRIDVAGCSAAPPDGGITSHGRRPDFDEASRIFIAFSRHPDGNVLADGTRAAASAHSWSMRTRDCPSARSTSSRPPWHLVFDGCRSRRNRWRRSEDSDSPCALWNLPHVGGAAALGLRSDALTKRCCRKVVGACSPDLAESN